MVWFSVLKGSIGFMTSPASLVHLPIMKEVRMLSRPQIRPTMSEKSIDHLRVRKGKRGYYIYNTLSNSTVLSGFKTKEGAEYTRQKMSKTPKYPSLSPVQKLDHKEKLGIR